RAPTRAARKSPVRLALVLPGSRSGIRPVFFPRRSDPARIRSLRPPRNPAAASAASRGGGGKFRGARRRVAARTAGLSDQPREPAPVRNREAPVRAPRLG